MTGGTRKSLILIPVIMSSAIGLVMILAWTAIKPISQKNGFSRKFTKTTAALVNARENDGIVDLAGETEQTLYFQTKEPSRLIATNYHLENERVLAVTVPNNKRMLNSDIIIDSPDVTILAGRMPAVIENKLNNPNSFSYKFPKSLYTRAAKIGPNSFIFRAFDTTTGVRDQIFLKGNPGTGYILREKGISELKNDAGISTDGLLNYDKQTNLIVYTQFYQNIFLCIDTNLNLVYRGRTIDTITTSSIKSGKDEGIMTAITPKRLVNATCCVSNGLLYNISMLKGDNETAEDFRKRTTIDIYDIRSGEYRGSFTIPVYNHERIVRFKIVREMLVAFYRSNIVVYQLSHS